MSNENKIGFSRLQYMGGKSTLCTGCGHDSITNHIISAFFQSNISPYDVAKVSGIGCSSKTPTYFLKLSHGFNSIHGRMAPLATGVNMANKQLKIIGVSGDGDSGSIGFGGFAHLIRRNVEMIYIVENNGVYGLTKGQFSATADLESTIKSGEKNPFETIDLCAIAIELGCRFVARSFSGDAKQMVPLIDAAIRHKGTALIDVISPCVTFANHEGSTKSYNYVKDHKVNLQELGYIQPQQEISVDYEAGEAKEVEMHDGSVLTLRKLEKNYDYSDQVVALNRLHQARRNHEVLTGLLYYRADGKSYDLQSDLTSKPLSQLQEGDLRPSETDMEEMLKPFS